MKRYGSVHVNIAHVFCVFLGFFVLEVQIQAVRGETYPISGKVTDIVTGTPVEGARITILDAVTREVVHDNISTDENGEYEATIEFTSTGIESHNSLLPASYDFIDVYPNPVSAASPEQVTVQYAVPGKRPGKPELELYNILGSRVSAYGRLPEGLYFLRLRFSDGYLTGSRRIVIESERMLRFSLRRVPDEKGVSSFKSAADAGPLSDSIKVLFVIQKSGYICTERSKMLISGVNNINHFSLVGEGQKSSAAIDSTGGILTVANLLGDTITLEIPPYAIWESTKITLTTMATPPDNPVGKNVFPGVSITPGGLTLLQPALLKVDLASASLDTGSAALFSVRQSDFILPVGHQTVSEQHMSGKIHHFSEYIGSEPTADEAGPQADHAGGVKPSDPYGWEDTHDCVDALLWWAEFLTRNGRLEEAQECYDKAKEIAERDAGDFLDLPVPDDPCGDYLTALMKFAQLVNLLVGGELESRIQDRVIEVVNRCDLRGEIEYDHQIRCTDPDRYTDTRITGRIPFYVDTQEPPFGAIHGGGEAKVTISGSQEECWLTASGIHRVNDITGELKADHQGIYWLEMTLNETWYESTTIYVTCPDPENNSHGQMYSFTYPTQVRFLVEDGYTATMPDLECAGSYRWRLYIIHQP